jgi:hypothetical protein
MSVAGISASLTTLVAGDKVCGTTVAAGSGEESGKLNSGSFGANANRTGAWYAVGLDSIVACFLRRCWSRAPCVP